MIMRMMMVLLEPNDDIDHYDNDNDDGDVIVKRLYKCVRTSLHVMLIMLIMLIMLSCRISEQFMPLRTTWKVLVYRANLRVCIIMMSYCLLFDCLVYLFNVCADEMRCDIITVGTS